MPRNMLSTSQLLPHVILTIILLNKDIFIIYYPILGPGMLSNPIQFKAIKWQSQDSDPIWLPSPYGGYK